MSGVFAVRQGPLGLTSLVSLVVLSGIVVASQRPVSFGSALSAFFVLFLLRQVFLFRSFGPDGLAASLKQRLGAEPGFELYQAASAVSLLGQRLGFVLLLLAAPSPPIGSVATSVATSVTSLGALLLALGVGASVWAAHVTSVDTYYHRDLFMGPQHVSFTLRGPYALLRNPVYDMEALAGYGAALLAFSPVALAAAALAHVAAHAFNVWVEQPHLRAATRISVDVELRETLAHTLTDPLSRPQLGVDGERRSTPPPRRSRSSPPPPPRRRHGP